MPLSPEEWHSRYTRQAGWTEQVRHYLLESSEIQQAKLILDCGSGTGALEAIPGGIYPGWSGRVIGLDINGEYLAYARQQVQNGLWTQGNCLQLPFSSGTFDIVFCHFLLLWIGDPLHALREMKRVARIGGSVIAMAEPDYGGRIDFPPEMQESGSWQQASLRKQGANPTTGRRLNWLLHQADLVDVTWGVLGAQWKGAPSEAEIESEWAVLHNDLESLLGTETGAHWQSEFEKLKQLDKIAWERGERVLYVPTFYACGKKQDQ